MKSITIFSNGFLGLPAKCDLDQEMVVYEFILRLLAEVWYNNYKSLGEILDVEACNKVWKVAQAPGDKRSRTQVNLHGRKSTLKSRVLLENPQTPFSASVQLLDQKLRWRRQ